VCPFTQTARTLAGVGPQTADTTGPGAATLAGLRVAREQDES
jgi:NADH-quinone oxidoreductase subunit E